MDEYCRYLKSDIYKLRRSCFFCDPLALSNFGGSSYVDLFPFIVQQ